MDPDANGGLRNIKKKIQWHLDITSDITDIQYNSQNAEVPIGLKQPGTTVSIKRKKLRD